MSSTDRGGCRWTSVDQCTVTVVIRPTSVVVCARPPAFRWRKSLRLRSSGRTLAGQEVVMSATRLRSERLEVRTTKDERSLIDRAVAEQGTDLTEFVISNLTVAARRVLADRAEFRLDQHAAEAWDAVNRRRGRDLPGLRRLMERPSPFADTDE